MDSKDVDDNNNTSPGGCVKESKKSGLPTDTPVREQDNHMMPETSHDLDFEEKVLWRTGKKEACAH